MQYLYTVLIYLALPFIFLKLGWRSFRNKAYQRHWLERLGFCPFTLKKCIWIHAVSLGETLAAIPLVKALKNLYPELPILMTNMTPTGRERVKTLLGDQVFTTYLPYDVPDAINRFLNRVQPLVFIVIETELWPNLFAACKKRHVPIIVNNARLSEKSAKGYQTIRWLTQPLLNTIDVLAVQTVDDRERFLTLGMPKDRVHITGNIKFDLKLPLDLKEKSEQLKNQLPKGPIWLAASTHPQEEALMLAAHQLIKKHYPDAILILVPRHPDRFADVEKLIKNTSFQYAKKSDKLPVSSPSLDIYLGDTMGELLLFYAMADVACVCGSFQAPGGGHNLIEPALLQKPIISGPYLMNFTEIANLLLKAEGMLIANTRTSTEIAEIILKLFNNKDLQRKLGNNALQVAENNRGALSRQLKLIQLEIERNLSTSCKS